MISRRTLLRASVLSVPVLGIGVERAVSAATPATLPVDVVNNSGSNTVYAYVTGQAIDNGNALMLLEADGQTPYYPPSPSSQTPVAVDCAIPLNASGSSPKTITIPHIAGGRIWFSIGSTLTFSVNPGPALVEPSVSNPSDPNITVLWDFCEFTYDASQLYANISFVDFVALPIGLTLATSSGTQTIAGLPTDGLNTISSALTAQAASDGSDWGKLIVTANGRNIRALSPNQAMAGGTPLFSGYFDNYIDQVWSKYTSSQLTIDTQYTWGTVTGQVVNGLLAFNGVGTFAKPATKDVFSCSSGPFTTGNDEMGNISARLAAAFNRTTLLIDSNQPDGELVSNYYTAPQTNHYARIVHTTATNGLGYAFPYDDVHPTGGTDLSGSVQSANPTRLTVTLGGLNGSGKPSA
ncbi:hypothetical protein F6W96_26615 [Nocardia terpenica]|uniref:GH64 domain-containing protein n=1 Tax=Nocardia terpenica TaxID=455432 RepID=A0A6G9Z877_9NOCA|nr:hypothetical protein F6W96_26615 [Nocardia terpenica]